MVFVSIRMYGFIFQNLCAVTTKEKLSDLYRTPIVLDGQLIRPLLTQPPVFLRFVCQNYSSILCCWARVNKRSSIFIVPSIFKKYFFCQRAVLVAGSSRKYKATRLSLVEVLWSVFLSFYFIGFQLDLYQLFINKF